MFLRFAILTCLLVAPFLYGQETLWKFLKTAQATSKVWQAATISDADLGAYMRQVIQSMDKEQVVCSEKSSYTKRLKQLTTGLNDIDGLKVNYKVYYDKTTINAFASPDGSIRVYSGLMDIMTDNEIRGILGHEIGHLAKRHSIKQHKVSLIASAARDGLMLTDGKIGALATSGIGDLSELLLTSHYSRVQETEADEYGYYFLKEHGYSPTTMIQALNKLRQMENNESKYAQYVITLFSTHPYIADRIDHLCSIATFEGYSCNVCQ